MAQILNMGTVISLRGSVISSYELQWDYVGHYQIIEMMMFILSGVFWTDKCPFYMNICISFRYRTPLCTDGGIYLFGVRVCVGGGEGAVMMVVNWISRGLFDCKWRWFCLIRLLEFRYFNQPLYCQSRLYKSTSAPVGDEPSPVPTLADITLQWRQNGHDSVSNHQPHDCLLKRLFRRRSKIISKLRVTGLCAGNLPGTGEFPAQMASNAENVSIWWRHHEEYHTSFDFDHNHSTRATNQYSSEGHLNFVKIICGTTILRKLLSITYNNYTL